MSNAYALCEPEDVRLYYGIPDDKFTDDYADLVEALIDRVSVMIETYLDKNVLSRDYEEYFDGKGTDKLFPSHYPITSVSGIWDDSDWQWDSSTEIDSSDYRVVDQTHITYQSNFNSGNQNLKIEYTAGYSTVPLDIKQVCIAEVARNLRDKTDKNFNVIQKTMSDGSIIYETKPFTPQSQMILDRYRRRWAY